MDALAIALAFPVISKQVNRQQIIILLRELEQILRTTEDGAVVEFGCYKGTTSLFVRRLLNEYGSDRAFHVYDSFEGLPPKAPEDASGAGEQFVAGELAVSKKQLLLEFKKANLAPPIVHKGWFSELAASDIPGSIAFAFLDGDFYDSICDSLALVLPRLAPRATIVIDDYAREALPGVAKAVKAIAPQLVPTIQIQHNLGIIRT
ncbi:MAG: TylF/MycF/NovP-related O-methyltransferase [Candidatus Saccharimonadales bacterium]